MQQKRMEHPPVPTNPQAARIHSALEEARTVLVTASCPPCMQRPGPWRVEDFDLTKQLYKGKASLLFRGTCRLSGTPVGLKLYRKSRLSALNWFQVGYLASWNPPHATHEQCYCMCH